MNHHKWLSEKPEFKEECLLITAVKFRDEWEYEVYIIKMIESDEGCYMGWLTGDGDEYGDLADLTSEKYFTTPLL